MAGKKKNWTIRRKMILLLIPAIIVVLTIATIFSLQLSSAAQKDAAYDETLNSARAYAHDFNTGMSDNLAKSETFSLVLGQNTGMTRQGALAIQHTLLEDNPHAIGIGVIFEPGAFDGQDARYANTPGHTATGRFASYWNRLNGTESLIPVVDIETSDWYTVPKQTQKAMIMEPEIYEGILMTSYITPIIKNGTFAGTVGIDVPLENIDRIVSQVKVFDTGYAFLVSNTGIFVSAPKKEYIGRMSLDELSRETNNPALAAMAVDIRKGKEGHVEMADPFTGKNVVMFYSPIQTGNWSMVVVAPTDEMLAGTANLGRIMLLIGLLSIVVVGGIIIIVARNLSEPIVAMSRTADRIASGDLDVHVPDQEGELGVLANAFNNMAARLRELIGRLEAQIIELQNTQLALRKAHERLRHFVDANIIGVVIASPSGGIIETNDYYLRMLGYTRAEFEQGKVDWRAITPPEWLPADEHAIEELRTRGICTPYEKEYIRRDGTRVPVLLSNAMLPGPEEQIAAFVLDITERKRTGEAIALANRKLTLMNDVAYQFIQNKITALRGYTELCKDAKTEAERLSFIEKGDHILADIHELIKNTREYQEIGVLQSRWISVEQSIRIAVSLVNPKPGISIESALNGLEMYTEPLIEKIFANLIENAVIHGKTTTRIRFSYEEKSKGLILICEDDGVGISPENKAHLFDRSVGQNIHFGLFFIRECLSLSSMTIAETGIPGKGARFEITVPKGMYRFTGTGEK